MRARLMRVLVSCGAIAIFSAAAAISSCSTAHAEGLKIKAVGVHVGSHHFPRLPDQHDFNPGVYVVTEEGWTAGIYRNTLGRTSVYGGYTFGDRLALTVGVVSGYRRAMAPASANPNGHCDIGMPPCYREVGEGGRITIMLAPSVRVGPSRWSYVPRIGSGSAAIHLSIERRF